MKVKYIVIMAAILSMLSGCAVTDQMFDNAADYAYDLAQSDDSYVKTIKSAKMLGYNFTYEKAFSNFFAHPKWKHFTSDDGVEVVEFTGDWGVRTYSWTLKGVKYICTQKNKKSMH